MEQNECGKLQTGDQRETWGAQSQCDETILKKKTNLLKTCVIKTNFSLSPPKQKISINFPANDDDQALEPILKNPTHTAIFFLHYFFFRTSSNFLSPNPRKRFVCGSQNKWAPEPCPLLIRACIQMDLLKHGSTIYFIRMSRRCYRYDNKHDKINCSTRDKIFDHFKVQ